MGYRGTLARPGMARLAAASSIGTTLEWYDFTVYNVLAALVFGRVFFPSYEPLTGTLLSFSTYAVGYLSRPIGGFVFGHLGDRRGRRYVLVTTLLLMGVATALMGLLPSYRTLGVWSPVLLVILRFAQGAAIGGEWAGAVLLSVEHGDRRHRGRNGSFAQMGPACGTILGTAVVAAISYALPARDFDSWGWRLPFLLSFGLVVFGLWLRRGVDETPVFIELESRRETSRTPVIDVFREHTRPLLTSIGARVGPDILYALLVVFTLTYVTLALHLSRSLALTAIMIGAAFHAVAIPFFGDLSDRVGRRAVYAVGTLLSIIWAFAYFMLMDTRHPELIVLAVVVGMILHATMYGPQAALITEQFPSRVRYAGSSLAYTLTGVVAGGFAPLIFTALYKSYGSTIRLSVYLAIALLITLLALSYAREEVDELPVIAPRNDAGGPMLSRGAQEP
jgi:MFS family permease